MAAQPERYGWLSPGEVVVRPPVSAGPEPARQVLESSAIPPVQLVWEPAVELWPSGAELPELSLAAVLPFQAGASPKTPGPLP